MRSRGWVDSPGGSLNPPPLRVTDVIGTPTLPLTALWAKYCKNAYSSPPFSTLKIPELHHSLPDNSSQPPVNQSHTSRQEDHGSKILKNQEKSKQETTANWRVGGTEIAIMRTRFISQLLSKQSGCPRRLGVQRPAPFRVESNKIGPRPISEQRRT